MEECAPADVPAAAAPPDDAPCWSGDWHRVPGLTDVWAQAALARTVATLPRLHPWRLGDSKGSARQLQWVAQDASSSALGVLAVTARDPELDAADVDGHPAVVLTAWALDRVGRAVAGEAPQWAGAVVRLPGTWLPGVALLPRALRDLDDPATTWPTESLDFSGRWSVHASAVRVAADLLTPAVIAAALDHVPPLSAVTVAGDALHVWWPYRGDALRQVGRVARAGRAARRLADAFPHFVLADHPDRSDEVERGLDERREAAVAYRASRRPGRSVDPVLQRIYDQARGTQA
ncbi:hypothetical protein [Angustibacter peucedani]